MRTDDAIPVHNGTAAAIPAGGLVQPTGAPPVRGRTVVGPPATHNTTAVWVADARAPIPPGRDGLAYPPGSAGAPVALSQGDLKTLHAAPAGLHPVGARAGSHLAAVGYGGLLTAGPATSGLVPVLLDAGYGYGGNPLDIWVVTNVCLSVVTDAVEPGESDPDGLDWYCVTRKDGTTALRSVPAGSAPPGGHGVGGGAGTAAGPYPTEAAAAAACPGLKDYYCTPDGVRFVDRGAAPPAGATAGPYQSDNAAVTACGHAEDGGSGGYGSGATAEPAVATTAAAGSGSSSSSAAPAYAQTVEYTNLLTREKRCEVNPLGCCVASTPIPVPCAGYGATVPSTLRIAWEHLSGAVAGGGITSGTCLLTYTPQAIPNVSYSAGWVGTQSNGAGGTVTHYLIPCGQNVRNAEWSYVYARATPGYGDSTAAADMVGAGSVTPPPSFGPFAFAGTTQQFVSGSGGGLMYFPHVAFVVKEV